MTATCVRCGEDLVDANRPCGFCEADRRRDAVLKLVAAAKSTDTAALAARVDAIDTLRSLGHSKEQVLLARARALDGDPVGEILNGLLAGGAERVGVVA
jgi:uncharacterized pyridoxal phosphate-containing UPF0001 family protein